MKRVVVEGVPQECPGRVFICVRTVRIGLIFDFQSLGADDESVGAPANRPQRRQPSASKAIGGIDFLLKADGADDADGASRRFRGEDLGPRTRGDKTRWRQ